MSIIIVDDNATNQLIVMAILNKAGYEDLRMVSSAKELYSLLGIGSPEVNESSVDLILMDMMMPEIDGLQACRRIQEEERFKDVPIIFVTAVGDSSKMAEALDAGASDYVMKPINKMELLARIRSALRLKKEIDWHKERDKRIKYKLELAKQVQRSVLSLPIHDENVEISAVYQPSSELAGDFYAWYRIDKNRYGAILLDIMGHGISSSLVCMYIYSVLQDAITRISDPEQVMNELNRYMNKLYMKDELLNYYFTAIYLVLDTEQKTIEYVNAGHPPGFVLMDDKVTLLTQGSCAIGLFENIEISKGKITYEDSIKIVLYTDGLTEAMGEGGEVTVDMLVAHVNKRKDMELPELAACLIPEQNHGTERDDICLVMLTAK
ncbi:PP2C family protein-serine/threonine phosphatase [Paenibacillus prosopidis]|uniref:Sigma-B regulation protein RsbU (Phosphoserine phosphatase) n=1 Tax=Paenibacillus prosopidis TaxID=630520 RepID=A0A368W3V4_9BACL|nr:fused response regulator/phosphatase [Paenibacillus prosopidis]RCW48831.1 sigma-B regulation protein RsbU (phosphoserine phosphatase) [Paenibacillus prosopidis]